MLLRLASEGALDAGECWALLERFLAGRCAKKWMAGLLRCVDPALFRRNPSLRRQLVLALARPGNESVFDVVASWGWTAKNLDSMLGVANEAGATELAVRLLNLRAEKFGDGAPASSDLSL